MWNIMLMYFLYVVNPFYTLTILNKNVEYWLCIYLLLKVQVYKKKIKRKEMRSDVKQKACSSVHCKGASVARTKLYLLILCRPLRYYFLLCVYFVYVIRMSIFSDEEGKTWNSKKYLDFDTHFSFLIQITEEYLNLFQR